MKSQPCILIQSAEGFFSPSVNAKLAYLKRKNPYKLNLIVWTAQNECGGSVGQTAKSRNLTPFLNLRDCSLRNVNSALLILQTLKQNSKRGFSYSHCNGECLHLCRCRVHWAHNLQCLKIMNRGVFFLTKVPKLLLTRDSHARIYSLNL